MGLRNLNCAILVFLLNLFHTVSADEGLKFVVTKSKLPKPRELARAFYDGGDFIYLIGGSNGAADFAELVKYSVDVGSVEVILTTDTFFGGSALLTGAGHDIVYFGGYSNGGSEILNQVRRISTSTGNVTLIGTLPQPSILSAAAGDAVNGVGYVFGGNSLSGGSNAVLLYNSSTDEIAAVAELPTATFGISAAWHAAQGLGYLFGGSDTMHDIQKFDPVAAHVSLLPAKLPDPTFMSCALQADGDIYIIGQQRLTKFDPATEDAVAQTIEGWPDRLLFSSCAFVPRLNRIYLLGGWGSFSSGGPGRYMEEIMYIQLGQETTDQPTASTTTTERPPPVDCSDGQLRVVPNPFCCESFYICNAGVPVKMECAENLQFNPESLQCEEESTVGFVNPQ